MGALLVRACTVRRLALEPGLAERPWQRRSWQRRPCGGGPNSAQWRAVIEQAAPTRVAAGVLLLVSDLCQARTPDGSQPRSTGLHRGRFAACSSVGRALPKTPGAGAPGRDPTVGSGGLLAQGGWRVIWWLVAGGESHLRGQASAGCGVAFTAFDHNDCNNSAAPWLTPRNPAAGSRCLAFQCGRRGIRQGGGRCGGDGIAVSGLTGSPTAIC